ncbi:THAP domain-containing protein 3-like [Camponotus floridanus]|uniref:THAP domain-containing protein 3-like n=1 Tax=Camponotus floridanus TaxID=104421 RepID=UPI000DC6C8DE|nr:THAP domain-containing protein 3-like [Camponotus floridanus]
MGKICGLKNCLNSSDSSMEFSFHSFPMKDDKKYKKWIMSIPKDLLDLPLKQHTYICSKHFSHDSYVLRTARNVLFKDASPSIFYVTSSNDADKENIEDL